MSRNKHISRSYYLEQKALLQIELLKLQYWVKNSEQRIVVLFEGRDGAGKSSTIKRFMEHLNPRGARVVALNKPSDTEQKQWFFQRYIQQLPTEGEMTFFDRSWYNRAGVEKVMGYVNDDKYQQFLNHVPQLERLLVEDGIYLFKYWLNISRKEQQMRFKLRSKDILKSWKLSPVDLAAQEKWEAYSEARDIMFQYTHSESAPWTIIRSDDKRAARINCMRHFLSQLPYPDKDESVLINWEPEIVLSPITKSKN